MDDTGQAQQPDTTQTAQTTAAGATTPAAPDASGGNALQTQTPANTATIPEQAPQQAPTVLMPVKRGGLGGLVDEIRNALAPPPRQEYIDPDTGKRMVYEAPQTPGGQWRRLAGEALQGAAAGLANGQGPGGAQRAAAAGIEAGFRQHQQEQAQQEKQADEDYQLERQNRIDKANTYLQQVQLATQQFALKRLQVKAGHDDALFAQQMNDREQQRGSIDLGVYGDHYALPDVQKAHPEINFWQQGVRGMIQAHPEIDPETGEQKGVHLWLTQPGILDQPAPPGTQAHRVEYDKDNVPHVVPFTPTGVHSNREIQSMDDYAYGVVQKYQSGQAENSLKAAQAQEAKARAAEAPSEAARNYASAEKDRAEVKQLNSAADQQTIASNAQQLVEGSMDPSNLSKRAKTYDATLAAANTYSMQKYGKPFDIAKAQADYRFATNTQTFNTLNYLNSLVGRNNNSGNLGVLVNMSNNLPRTQFPPLNRAEQWAKLSSGNPQVASYYAAITEVSDQIAKILQGGGSGGGGTSDAKLRQASDLFNKGFTAQQIAAVANDTLRPLLANRKQEIIGDNRYLLQWHGGSPQQPQQSQAGQYQYKTADGKMGWNGQQWVPIATGAR